jgi:hypothetical protein
LPLLFAVVLSRRDAPACAGSSTFRLISIKLKVLDESVSSKTVFRNKFMLHWVSMCEPFPRKLRSLRRQIVCTTNLMRGWSSFTWALHPCAGWTMHLPVLFEPSTRTLLGNMPRREGGTRLVPDYNFAHLKRTPAEGGRWGREGGGD